MLMLRCVQYFFSTFHPAFSFTFQNPVNPEASFTQILHAFVLFSLTLTLTLRPPSLLQSWSSPVHPEVLFPCRIGPLFRQIFDKNFSREGGHPPPFTLPPPLTRPSASEYSVYRFLVLLGWQLCPWLNQTVTHVPWLNKLCDLLRIACPSDHGKVR